MLRRGKSPLSTRVRMCGWAGAGVPELSASARADAARACRHVFGVCMCVCAGVQVWVGGMGFRRSQAVGPGAQVWVFPSPRGLLYSCSTEPGSCESKG